MLTEHRKPAVRIWPCSFTSSLKANKGPWSDGPLGVAPGCSGGPVLMATSAQRPGPAPGPIQPREGPHQKRPTFCGLSLCKQSQTAPPAI